MNALSWSLMHYYCCLLPYRFTPSGHQEGAFTPCDAPVPADPEEVQHLRLLRRILRSLMPEYGTPWLHWIAPEPAQCAAAAPLSPGTPRL